jgi:hypothetical protein
MCIFRGLESFSIVRKNNQFYDKFPGLAALIGGHGLSKRCTRAD